MTEVNELFPELNRPAPVFIDGPDVMTAGTLRAWATFSIDKIYRYILGRIWDPDRALLICGMLNPSIADENILDPTIRRVVGFAKRDGFGGIIVWNALALVSTNPKRLLTHPDCIGPRNYEAIRNIIVAQELCKIVIAWGKPPSRKLFQSIRLMESSVGSLGRSLWQFGPSTKDGFPRHPLYLRSDTPIQLRNTNADKY